MVSVSCVWLGRSAIAWKLGTSAWGTLSAPGVEHMAADTELARKRLAVRDVGNLGLLQIGLQVEVRLLRLEAQRPEQKCRRGKCRR